MRPYAIVPLGGLLKGSLFASLHLTNNEFWIPPGVLPPDELKQEMRVVAFVPKCYASIIEQKEEMEVLMCVSES